MTSRYEDIASALPKNLDELPRRNGFRLRGLEMTRLEGFVDAAFAFAITMLVIAGQQVPDDVRALLAAFRNVPAFAASVAVLALFWRGHWLWSRRFGLEDGISIAISWAMIFTMLVYVYPLKVIFGGMFYAIGGDSIGHRLGLVSWAQVRQFFSAYALGFTAVSLEVLLLNWHAWQLRGPLQLNKREQLATINEISGWSVPVLVGLMSLALAWLLPDRLVEWSGWIYLTLIVLVPLLRVWRRRVAARIN